MTATQPDLFTDRDPTGQAARAAGRDITAGRHGGNPQSREAFERIEEKLPSRRLEVLRLVQDAGARGLTCKEFCQIKTRRTGEIHAAHQWSGRFTELVESGHIYRREGDKRDGYAVNYARS